MAQKIIFIKNLTLGVQFFFIILNKNMDKNNLNNKNEQQSNNENGFLTLKEALEYLRKRKEEWGDNLVAWIEERNNRFFVCFNLWD